MAAASKKKLQYKIGEACRKLDIQPYVLRYWETEFPFLQPDKSKSGQRVYTPEELEVIARIKELLYEEGYTIAGAKKKLEAELESGGPEKGTGKAAGKSAAPPKDDPDGSDQPAPAQSPPADGDSEAAERLNRVRAGLEQLLGQARDILERLDG
jgi:DNA-binding transcriptional MerR regulator